VFRDAGFADRGNGTFERAATADAPPIDATIYTLAICAEAELTRFAQP